MRLKQAFLTLPVIAPHRLIILRQIHKLKSADIQVLINFCQKPAKHCDLILESTENTLKGDLKDLPLYAKGVVLGKPEGPNVFDMTKLITAHRSGDALKMLDGFYRDGCASLADHGCLGVVLGQGRQGPWARNVLSGGLKP